MANDPLWIEHAHLKKGALRAKAKSAGLAKGDAPLTETALGKLAKSKDATTRKQAHTAETLKKLRK